MAKKNGNTLKMIAIVVGVTMAVAGWVWNAAVLSSDVGRNTESRKELEPKVDVVEEKCVRLELKLDRLDEKLTEQNTKQQAMLVLQQQILEAVTSE